MKQSVPSPSSSLPHSAVNLCSYPIMFNCRVICHWGASFFEDVPLVKFMYLVFTHMPGESCRR